MHNCRTNKKTALFVCLRSLLAILQILQLIRWCSWRVLSSFTVFSTLQNSVHSLCTRPKWMNTFWRVGHILDASKMTLNYNSIFSRRVENVQDASPKYATIFQCYFGRIMQIFDAFRTRHLNSATRQKCNYNPNVLP